MGDGRSPGGRLTLRPLKVNDIMCFNFNYPRRFAWIAREDRRHPCLAVVEVRYPHSGPSAGRYTDKWQLYGMRGVAGFRTAPRNQVCRVIKGRANRTGNRSHSLVRKWEGLQEGCYNVSVNAAGLGARPSPVLTHLRPTRSRSAGCQNRRNHKKPGSFEKAGGP